jgi:hypothetical protein
MMSWEISAGVSRSVIPSRSMQIGVASTRGALVRDDFLDVDSYRDAAS